MSRENLLTTGAMMDALMVANHINHHTDAEKKTAYMHSHIKQTKPNDAENSGAVVRVGSNKKFANTFIKNTMLVLLVSLFLPNSLLNAQTNTINTEDNLIVGFKGGANFDYNLQPADKYVLGTFRNEGFSRTLRSLYVESNFPSYLFGPNWSIRAELLSTYRDHKPGVTNVNPWLQAGFVDIRIPIIYNFKNSIEEGVIPYVFVAPYLSLYDDLRYTYRGDLYYHDRTVNSGSGLAVGGGIKYPIELGPILKFLYRTKADKIYLGLEGAYAAGLKPSTSGLEIAITLSVPLGRRSKTTTVEYPSPPKVTFVDKPCYEVNEILSFIDQGIKVSRRKICLFNVLYSNNDTEINLQSQSSLDDMVALMNKMPKLYIIINGHTDSRGDKAYNQNLSVKRAKGVYDYMVKKGISESRLSYKGYGSERPIATNDTEAGRSQNRRVEFEILKY